MGHKNIVVERDGEITTLTVNRPAVLNSLDEETLLELEAVFNELNDDRPGVIIVTGAGDKAFVAGGDVAMMSAMDVQEAKAFCQLGHRIMDLIENHPKPVIAAINGYAVGGGCELALACDVRIAADSAKFGLPEINLGIIPGWGATHRLSRLIGRGRAKELIFTGDIIDAESARQVGLVNRVVPPSDLPAAAKELAEKLSEKPFVALSLAKKAINESDQVHPGEGTKIEAECFSQCFATQDQKEGMDAFLNKRKPIFRGK